MSIERIAVVRQFHLYFVCGFDLQPLQMLSFFLVCFCLKKRACLQAGEKP